MFTLNLTLSYLHVLFQGPTLIAVGLGVAAAGFAGNTRLIFTAVVFVYYRAADVNIMCWTGRYAFQLWKPLGQVVSETVKKMPTSVSYFIKLVQLPPNSAHLRVLG